MRPLFLMAVVRLLGFRLMVVVMRLLGLRLMVLVMRLLLKLRQ